MAFSLFFFSGDGATEREDRYRLLLDCAEYADRAGYAAIWIPERHFVEFGGLYPNPSVLAAALAVRTNRVQIRAGSVVLPLHHPVRVTEEWSVVDNLSGGRAAIACASGWHPDDFLLAPGTGADRYPTRKDDMVAAIDTIRRLWAGERVEFPGPDGTPVAVRTLPRPVQPTLPLWLAAQSNVDTFVRAGELGANVLTGLLGQPLPELRDKIDKYRAARQLAGHNPATGQVTVMVHALLGDADDEVISAVRDPLLGYLRTFLAQQRDGFDALNTEDREAMLAAAFDCYCDGQALFGTPRRCEALVEDLVDTGVDEIACLVDFGVQPDRVVAGLEYLGVLQEAYRPEWQDPVIDRSRP
jgi:natural product biosynthesis luciferase-like monooxygenase protein